MDSVEKLMLQRVTREGVEETGDVVVRELPVTIFFNSQELVTLLATPENLDYLAVGFLVSEGLVRSKDDIKKVLVDDVRGVVRVYTAQETGEAGELIFKRLITSGCGRGAMFYRAADVQGQMKVESDTTVTTAQITALVKDFHQRSELYRATGGAHSAALCDPEAILVFNEDIGRHNAVDKVFGKCVMKGIPTAGRIVLTSGRVSSEIVLKVAKGGIPLLVSHSAPTSLGVKLSNDTGVTMLGFARGSRLNIYTHSWRIITDGSKGEPSRKGAQAQGSP